jgi:hypothetical protein
MAELTLRQAAQQVGVSRQTMFRMANDGRLSVTVRSDPTRHGSDGKAGEGSIKVVDTAELLRVFGRLGPVTDAAGKATAGMEPANTGVATGATAPKPRFPVLTQEDQRREYEIASREAMRAELDAARATIDRVEAALQEARERESKLMELLAGQTRLLEHKAVAEAPPRKGFWRRVFAK